MLLPSELGAAVAVIVDGEPVVDLHGGFADVDGSRPWQQDTIVNTFSVTKGLSAVCALRLVEDGALDLDTPVATYWPEFAQSGKEHVTVRQVLAHQAGLPKLEPMLPREQQYDWSAVTSALARQAPAWPPGSRTAYHEMTWGYLVGELVRRADGRTLGTLFREDVAAPLDADVAIGVPEIDQLRCAEVTVATGSDADRDEERYLVQLARDANTSAWRSAEIPSANAHATAMGIAKVYAPLARGGSVGPTHVLAAGTISRATTHQTSAVEDFPFGLGFMLIGRILSPLGNAPPPPRSPLFGHPGISGCLGVADPTSRMAFGFVRNRMQSGGAAMAAPFALLQAAFTSLGRAWPL